MMNVLMIAQYFQMRNSGEMYIIHPHTNSPI